MASTAVVAGDQPLFTPRKLRVVAVGAGFANLTLAHKHKHMGDHSYMDLVIYEKNPEIGGTWYARRDIRRTPVPSVHADETRYENRYPGVACDVPAHIVRWWQRYHLVFVVV